MITCPWCDEQVHLVDDVCPACNHEVKEQHLQPIDFEVDSEQVVEELEEQEEDVMVIDAETYVQQHYKCGKCGHTECRVNKVAVNGTGLSKLLDIQYMHYLYVSCEHCGIVEIYDPEVLEGRTVGSLSTIFDVMLGG